MRRKITEKLLKWKSLKKERMPMLINGARQVGKTFTITEFGYANYKNIVYVNFEVDANIVPYFDGDIAPQSIVALLEKYYNCKIIPEETLIIFDEIQLCERALSSLKYFTEMAPEYHLIGAGSLLGVAVNREQFLFPVGKVYIQTMYPMNFEEFLWAKNKEVLAHKILEHFNSNKAMDDRLHIDAMNEYNQYLVIGGMPAVVKAYVSKDNIMSEEEIKSLILNSYIADMSKYASASQSVKTKSAYDSIPSQLAKDNKKFQYKLIKTGARASLFGESINWLLNAGVVLKCDKCEHGFMPPSVYKDLSSFKLYMSDVGLLASKTGITLNSLNSTRASQYTGAMSENFVACELVSNGFELLYWESKGIAEVDFVIVIDGKAIPVEVKAKTNTKSKSLSEFIKKYNPEYAMRISTKNFGFENNIKSVPAYASFCI